MATIAKPLGVNRRRLRCSAGRGNNTPRRRSHVAKLTGFRPGGGHRGPCSWRRLRIAGCVIAITVTDDALALLQRHGEIGAMASIRTYEAWWDLSLIDERNERPLLSAFVATIAVWAAAVLLTLI